MTVRQDLAREMLRVFDGKPERWTQRASARDAIGRRCLATDAAACAWCMVGAQTLAMERLGLGFEHAIFTENAHVDWNDAPRRTFAQVEAGLRRIAEGE